MKGLFPQTNRVMPGKNFKSDFLPFYFLLPFAPPPLSSSSFIPHLFPSSLASFRFMNSLWVNATSLGSNVNIQMRLYTLQRRFNKKGNISHPGASSFVNLPSATGGFSISWSATKFWGKSSSLMIVSGLERDRITERE